MFKLPANVIINHKPDVWGFVGSVSINLGYVRKSDGGTPTYEEITRDHMLPGNPKIRKIGGRYFKTKEALVSFAESLGYVYSSAGGTNGSMVAPLGNG